MSKPYKDITGQVYGRLTAIEREGKFWVCLCVCGKKSRVSKCNLSNGNSKSCGCLRVDNAKRISYKHGHSRKQRHSREYVSWTAMKQRCYDKKSTNYRFYGKLGVTVCPQWLNSFEAFLKDMGPRPEGHSLDRINCNGNYEPSNTRWAPNKLQGRNKKSTKLSEHEVLKLRKDPDSIIKIKEKYNTTEKYLKDILKGNRWKL